ncbi:MAG: hypothetical protein AAF907_08905, partial [Planctomycetota bacterium]
MSADDDALVDDDAWAELREEVQIEARAEEVAEANRVSTASGIWVATTSELPGVTIKGYRGSVSATVACGQSGLKAVFSSFA